jgi:hypothetical protein
MKRELQLRARQFGLTSATIIRLAIEEFLQKPERHKITLKAKEIEKDPAAVARGRLGGRAGKGGGKRGTREMKQAAAHARWHGETQTRPGDSPDMIGAQTSNSQAESDKSDGQVN